MAGRATIQRERISLALADGRAVDIERVRDPRARRLRLLVGERGVRLTVPRGASLAEAQAFLGQHRDWLDRQLQKRRDDTPRVALQRDICAELPLRGESLPLRWQCGRYAHLDLAPGELRMTLPAAAPERVARRLLRDFYLQQARADLARWLPTYLPELPRAPSVLRLRPLRSLWGSLSASNALSLDLSLVLGPPRAFEYVLVHELCHLLQRNHSPAFWLEVEHRFPDWRVQRAWLRGAGMALKGRLDALLGEPPAAG
jgi:predicted metal-dependent hydrolase